MALQPAFELLHDTSVWT